jgi:hypothetical protein
VRLRGFWHTISLSAPDFQDNLFAALVLAREKQAWRLTAALRLNALVALDRAQQGCLDSPEAVYRLLAPQLLKHIADKTGLLMPRNQLR